MINRRVVLPGLIVLAAMLTGCGGGSGAGSGGSAGTAGRSITGRAVNQAGQPISGARVALAPASRVAAPIQTTTTDVELRLPVACETCEATGAAPGTEATVCPQCTGSGEIRRIRHSLLGQMVTSTPCGRCGATGQIIERPCPTCRGEGRRTEARTYSVDVPGGVCKTQGSSAVPEPVAALMRTSWPSGRRLRA